jgi:hypothetical protein
MGSMTVSAISQLRDVNVRLRRFLEGISHGTLDEPSQSLSHLFGDLLAIGSLFENGFLEPTDRDQAPLIREYQALLTELQCKLPLLQARYLAERARLEKERSHLQVAALWTGAARHTTYFK